MTMRRPSLNMRTDSVFISGFLAGEESDPGQNSRDGAARKLCQKILSFESSGNAGKLVEISDLGESSSTKLRKTANDKKGSAQKNAGKNVDQGSRIFTSRITLKEKSSEEPQSLP